MSEANDTDLRAEEVDRLVADVLECAGALRRYGDALTRHSPYSCVSHGSRSSAEAGTRDATLALIYRGA